MHFYLFRQMLHSSLSLLCEGISCSQGFPSTGLFLVSASSILAGSFCPRCGAILNIIHYQLKQRGFSAGFWSGLRQLHQLQEGQRVYLNSFSHFLHLIFTNSQFLRVGRQSRAVHLLHATIVAWNPQRQLYILPDWKPLITAKASHCGQLYIEYIVLHSLHLMCMQSFGSPSTWHRKTEAKPHRWHWKTHSDLGMVTVCPQLHVPLFDIVIQQYIVLFMKKARGIWLINPTIDMHGFVFITEGMMQVMHNTIYTF